MPCTKEKVNFTSANSQNENYVEFDLLHTYLNLRNGDQIEVEHVQEHKIEFELENVFEHNELELPKNPLENYHLARDRMKKEIGPPFRFDELEFVTAFSEENFLKNEPDSYEEAIGKKDANFGLQP